ncbi:hypothetical protein SESBI_38228 [Sesbania bispinosa]|nr:hypothetical protein SESBI_38228 [Sesbania bispinosa]
MERCGRKKETGGPREKKMNGEKSNLQRNREKIIEKEEGWDERIGNMKKREKGDGGG